MAAIDLIVNDHSKGSESVSLGIGELAHLPSLGNPLGAMHKGHNSDLNNLIRPTPHPLPEGTPQQQLVAHAHRFAAFCTSDIARYQLLLQHVIPGFSPSPESYAPAMPALDSAGHLLERAGVRPPDTWTSGPP